MASARLAVGLAVFNGHATLRRALDSVLSQTFSDFQIIISDNASTDETAAICEQYAQGDARLVYHRQRENIGLARNFEFVLKHAQSPFFIRIAHDDYFDSPAYLARLFQVADQGYDLVFPAIRKFVTLPNGSIQNWPDRGQKALSDDRFAAHWELLKRHYLGYQIACGLIRREVLDSVSLWLKSIYFGNIPDEEPYLHFVLSRYRWKYVPDVFFAKDMTQSYYVRKSLWASLGPLFWQTVAVAGQLAQAEYTTSQKLALIATKMARSCYVAADLGLKDIRRLLRS